MNVFVLFRLHCSRIVHRLFAWTVCYSVEVYGVTATTVRNGCKLKLDFAEASVGSCWHCSRANSSLFTCFRGHTSELCIWARHKNTNCAPFLDKHLFHFTALLHANTLICVGCLVFFLSRKHNKLRVRVHQRASMWRHGRYLAVVLLSWILNFMDIG